MPWVLEISSFHQLLGTSPTFFVGFTRERSVFFEVAQTLFRIKVQSCRWPHWVASSPHEAWLICSQPSRNEKCRVMLRDEDFRARNPGVHKSFFWDRERWIITVIIPLKKVALWWVRMGGHRFPWAKKLNLGLFSIHFIITVYRLRSLARYAIAQPGNSSSPQWSQRKMKAGRMEMLFKS